MDALSWRPTFWRPTFWSRSVPHGGMAYLAEQLAPGRESGPPELTALDWTVKHPP